MIISNSGGAGVEDEGARSKVMGMGMGMGMVVKKGPWSASEDAVLIDYVKKHGEGNWNAVQRNTGLQRCGKSCRLRWANHLRPNLKKGAFTSIEERLIIDLHSKLGNKWARISAHLPGRTDNEIKNYWNTRVKRRIRQGLPLYPNDQQTPSSPPPQLHPPTLPLSLPKTPPPTLSLFNQISLSSPVFSLHHHHPPPPLHHLTPHSLKNCSQNSYMSSPIFPPTQVGPIQMNPMGLGFEPGRRPELDGFRFGNPSYEELPSNQYNQSNNNYGNNNNNGGNNYGEVENEAVKMDPNVGRANSGLLGDLLQEAHVMVGYKKEKQEDDVAFQWDASSSENSSTGVKKQECEEEQVNLDGEDIKNILEMIPSLVEAPGWCDDGCAESSAAQSSAVSTDDNYNNNINAFDDHQMPQPPSFGDDDDGGGDWNPESYYWDDNFPKFC